MVFIRLSQHSNGSCPLCEYAADCDIINFLEDNLPDFFDEDEDGQFELVIYKCPQFKREILSK